MEIKSHKKKSSLIRSFLLASGFFCFSTCFQIAIASNTGMSEVYASKYEKENLISGTVTDELGHPLVAVSIVVKGSNVGAVTDLDGNFQISVPNEISQLVFSYLGFVTQEVNISGKKNLSIVMIEDTKTLDELVVTALGIKRQEKALSYNVQEVKNSDITAIKDVNFINSLSGKVAGVNINSSSSGTGGATRVVMRGTKSISKDNNALYVIDGVPIFNMNNGGLDQNNEYANQPRGEGISDINPDDIESISVLTGAAAAALYGSNAANGAIIITTKKGVVGKPQVTISNQTSFENAFVLPRFQNKYGYRTGEYKSWGAAHNGENYDRSNFFKTGVVQQTTASLSVGNAKNQTYFSLGASNASGIVPENKYSKYNATLRNTTSFLDDKMTLNFGLSYIKQADQNMIAQGKYYNPIPAVYTLPVGENISNYQEFEKYDQIKAYNAAQWQWGDQGLELQNPYWLLNRNTQTNKRDRYMMNVGLTYDINEWLNIMGRARIDNSSNNYDFKKYATTISTFAPENGAYLGRQENLKQSYADLIMNINKSMGDINFVANIGTSISHISSEWRGAEGGLIVPNYFALTNIDKNYGKTRLIHEGWREQEQSIFANLEMGWKSMLYLTLTGRNDWSSALAKMKTKSFFYPSVGVSALISEMTNMPDDIFMKVRASYSSVGSAIPRNLSVESYSFDSQSGSWSTNSYRPVDDLKPEKTNSWELGLSSKFWHNKLSFDLTWYKSNTKNQTLNMEIPPASGYKSMYIQTGDVMNQGLEMALSTDQKFGDLLWNASLTASYNKNRIEQLIEKGKFFDEDGVAYDFGDNISQGGIGASEIRLTEGGTMGDLWIKKKLKLDESGNPVMTENGNPELDNDMNKVGSVLPSWNVGFRNNFSWKGFNFGFMLSGRFGGVVISHTQAILDGFGVSEQSAIARDNGGVKVGNQTFDAEKYYTSIGQTEGLLTEYVYSADNIRLQELSIGYTLPKALFNDIMKVNLSLIANNVFMLYNKAPFDPELTASTGTYFQGVDYFMQPSRRSLGLNVRIEF